MVMHFQSCLIRKRKRCSVMKFCTMTAVTLLCTYVTSESENRVLLIHAYHRQRDFVEFEAVSPTSINFVKFLKVLSVFPVSVLNVK